MDNKLASDLLDKLLVLDPERRLSADAALNHEFFWKEPFPCELVKLMSTIKTNNLEYLVKNRQANHNRQLTSSKPATGFPEHIY